MGFLLGWEGVPSICWEVFKIKIVASSVSTEPGRPAATLASDQNGSYHFGPKCD